MTKSKVEVTSSFLKSPIQEQYSNERRPLKKKTKTPLVLSLIILILFIATLAFVFFGGLLNVKNYKVSGNIQVATKDIEDYVSTQSEGKLIVNVDPVSIETGLLNKFSLLSYARVTKELPSTLNIDIKERSKSAVLKTLENTVLVSQDGVVLEEIDDSQIQNNMYQGMNIVKMIDEPKRVKGYNFDPVFINNISAMINAWNTYKIENNPAYKSPAFADIIVDKDKNVKFILSDGGTALLSLSNNDVNIVKLVSDLLTAYNRLSQTKKIKNIDIRLENKIAVTYF